MINNVTVLSHVAVLYTHDVIHPSVNVCTKSTKKELRASCAIEIYSTSKLVLFAKQENDNVI
jgi:hypothetical protein